ncbi:MAG: CaiB/BaiF CoA transferase family protein, partial [Rickettsiales bacterium]
SGALAGIKVLDLSRVLAGPWATQMLGDFGAEVWKIERPGAGDDTRHWGPPFVTNADGSQGDAAYFMCANRNKTSIAIDITSAEGQEQLRTLAQACDVLVENFKVGQLQKYGLDYDTLSKLNPKLIYCSITGFGQTGPYANRPGYDYLIQAMGGMMSITGEADGKPGGGPQKIGVAMADIVTGLYASNAILAALHHRDQTGEGQRIDLSLLDCQLAVLANQNMNYLIGGKAPKRLGNAHPNIVPYQVFATSDDAIIIAVGNDGQFARLAALLGHSDWAQDARFATNEARVNHRETLVPMIQALLSEKRAREWLELLEANGIPCGPVNTIEQAFANPQIQHREMQRELTREDGTKIPTVANPIRLSKTPVEYHTA